MLRDYNDCAIQLSERPKVLLQRLQIEYHDLIADWHVQLGHLDTTNPKILTAFARFGRCVSDRGWTQDRSVEDAGPVSAEMEFFGVVDSRVVSAPDDIAARAVEQSAASDYADCMEDVEAIRQPLRTEARSAFVSEHADELLAAESLFNDGLDQLGLASRDS
jgi:hypothetical protein